MRFTAGAQGTLGGKRLTALVLLTLGVQLLSAGEIELGLQGVSGSGTAAGVTATFSGTATTGPWLFGGYGSGLWSPSLNLAGGGALVGIRPVPVLTLSTRVGLGAGFHAREAGATRQWGAEVSLAVPWNLVIAASWERVWNLAQLPSLPPAGWNMWCLGVRLRLDSDHD